MRYSVCHQEREREFVCVRESGIKTEWDRERGRFRAREPIPDPLPHSHSLTHPKYSQRIPGTGFVNLKTIPKVDDASRKHLPFSFGIPSWPHKVVS